MFKNYRSQEQRLGLRDKSSFGFLSDKGDPHLLFLGFPHEIYRRITQIQNKETGKNG